MTPRDDLLDAALLDSDHARRLAASQLVPLLMAILLHAKDIADRPALDAETHEAVCDVAHDCMSIVQHWSTDERLAARATAEVFLRQMTAQKPLLVRGMHGKVLGGWFMKDSIQ